MTANTFKQALFFDAANKNWIRFSEPEGIYQTTQIGDVQQVLDEIHQSVDHKKVAVGFITYDASPAFDHSFSIHSTRADIPLIWFGLFNKRVILEQLPETEGFQIPPVWKADISRDEYQSKINRIHHHIKEGDTYQVNFTYRLKAEYSEEPYCLFYQLAQAQKADYAAFIETEDWAVCSASPEQFFELRGKSIESRPMKGTVHRGNTHNEDLDLRTWLYHSEKNRSENTMIVDMVRNDLGAIVNTEKVGVSEYFKIEKYPTVWQMTSKVNAETKATIPQIFSGLFPPASITGTPKTETTGIIRCLENSPRGIYTGSIGFFNHDRAQFNVAIRTAFVDKKNQQAEYGVGGGIVWDSDAESEWLETLTKAKILSSKRPEFSILESMLYEPDKGYFLLEEHIERLESSCDYFDYPFDSEELKEKLKELSSQMMHRCKVRVLLNSKGLYSIEFESIDQSTDGLQKVRLAKKPVKIDTPFVYFKTTNRSIYDDFNSQMGDAFDVILWNENGEITEGTRSNLVIQKNKEWLTPPVTSGLLAGTYRSSLLKCGKIREQKLTKQDLFDADQICMINSVRKWVHVELVK